MQLRQILFVCWLWTLEPKSLFLLFGWKFLRHTPVGNRGVTINKTNKIKVLPKSLSVLLCPGMPISQSHRPDCQILSKKNWKGKGEAIFDTLFMMQNRTANQAHFHPNWSGLAVLFFYQTNLDRNWWNLRFFSEFRRRSESLSFSDFVLVW